VGSKIRQKNWLRAWGPLHSRGFLHFQREKTVVFWCGKKRRSEKNRTTTNKTGGMILRGAMRKKTSEKKLCQNLTNGGVEKKGREKETYGDLETSQGPIKSQKKA